VIQALGWLQRTAGLRTQRARVTRNPLGQATVRTDLCHRSYTVPVAARLGCTRNGFVWPLGADPSKYTFDDEAAGDSSGGGYRVHLLASSAAASTTAPADSAAAARKRALCTLRELKAGATIAPRPCH
jgi:hypothetical protein